MEAPANAKTWVILLIFICWLYFDVYCLEGNWDLEGSVYGVGGEPEAEESIRGEGARDLSHRRKGLMG